MKPQALTHAQQERMRKEIRRQEDIREDHLRRLRDDALISTFQRSDERIMAKRFISKLSQEEHERRVQKGIVHHQENKQQRSAQLEAETKLARELDTLKKEKIRDEKMRQQIRENSYELRELEEKLRAGYMNKERAAQIAEKSIERMEEEKKEQELNKMMNQEASKATDNERKQQQRREEQAVIYQQELEKQLEEQEHRKQEEYEQFLKDKLLIDEAVRKIHEEDEDEQHRILEKQRATRAYIEEFKRKREEWKADERRRQEEENRKIVEFAEMQTNRETSRMHQATEREEQLVKLQERLATQIRMEEEQRNEMERLRQELYLEEQEEASRKAEVEEMQTLLRQRVELRQAHDQQMAYKQARLESEKTEEEIFRQQMLTKFANDDRIELLNAEARRRKHIEHRRAVEQLIDERRQRFEAKRQEEVRDYQEQLSREKRINEIIEEERLRLLEEHASKLAGYMPKGVFRNSTEIAGMTDRNLKSIYTRKEENSDSD